MTSRLIIECGSSKSDWVMISDHGLLSEKTLDGFNPHHNSPADLSMMLKEFLSGLDHRQPEIVLMYGAGITATYKVPVTQAIQAVLSEAEVQVYSDIHASAHATMGDEDGWVAILGTGSNLAYFKSGALQFSHSSLGWLLGDEGSGRAMIKAILRTYCRLQYSEALTLLIEQTIGRSPETVVASLYGGDSPLAIIDQIMVQLSGLFDHPEIKSTCEAEIARFLDIVINLQGQTHGPVHFTGSVASEYEGMIRTYLQENRVPCGKVIRYPMDQIVRKYVKSN